MNFFYLNQKFPINDKLWENITSSFDISFFKENYIVEPEKKLISLTNFQYNIPTTFYPVLLNYYKKMKYLKNNTEPEFVSTEFRKDWGLFFRGVHSIREEMVLETVKTVSDFTKVLEKFNGVKAEFGDISYILEPLQGVFLCYILWEGDEDLPPSLKILFDKKLADIFMQDIVWSIIVETNYRIKIHEKYFSLFN